MLTSGQQFFLNMHRAAAAAALPNYPPESMVDPSALGGWIRPGVRGVLFLRLKTHNRQTIGHHPVSKSQVKIKNDLDPAAESKPSGLLSHSSAEAPSIVQRGGRERAVLQTISVRQHARWRIGCSSLQLTGLGPTDKRWSTPWLPARSADNAPDMRPHESQLTPQHWPKATMGHQVIWSGSGSDQFAISFSF